MPQITYTNKVEGDTFTPADANELKSAINANAEWNGLVPYSADELIPYLGITYKSLQSANIDHIPVTDGGTDLWWEEVKTGGGVEIEGIVAVATTANTLMYFGTDGKLATGDNRELSKSILSGALLVATTGADENSSVLSSGFMEGFTGLIAGTDYYLGNSGDLVTKGALEYNEYIVSIGRAVSTTEMNINIRMPEPTRNQDDGNPVGSIKYFATYKDRSAYGYLPFAFDNAISQANYPVLFAEIGHVYNAQHVAAGDTDLSASTTLFYPTPVPGNYDRGGIPDSEVLDSTANIDITLNRIDIGASTFTALQRSNVQQRGMPFKLKLLSGSMPTGVSADTVYYASFSGSPYIYLYATESDAIGSDSADRIDITATATGTFRLTQEGITLDDAMQGHAHYHRHTITGGNSASYGGSTNYGTVNSVYTRYTGYDDTDPSDDGINGTPRTTNETRPKTNYSFGYIKAEHVTSAGEPISALRYDTGWVANSDWTDAGFTINHNLAANLSDLIVNFFVSTDGTDANSFSTLDSNNGAGTQYGVSPYQVSTSTIKLQTGVDGILYVVDAGGGVGAIDTEAWYYKVVITKPNLINTVFDVSNLAKTIDLDPATGGDYTATLPAISGAIQTRSYYWSGGEGTYKFSLTVNGVVYEGEGKGRMKIVSDGTNWQVEIYEDRLPDGFYTDWENVVKGINGYYTSGVFTIYNDNYTQTSLWARLRPLLGILLDGMTVSGAFYSNTLSRLSLPSLCYASSANNINFETIRADTGARDTFNITSTNTGDWDDSNRTSLSFLLTEVRWTDLL